LLIGGGIMSATLGTWLQEFHPFELSSATLDICSTMVIDQSGSSSCSQVPSVDKKMAVPRSQAVGPNSTRTNTRHEQETDVLLIGAALFHPFELSSATLDICSTMVIDQSGSSSCSQVPRAL
jgi:hypothetical protein